MTSPGEASTSSETAGVSNQLATLVPSFDPSKDDLQIYQQKVELVLGAWPSSRITELVTRLILNTSGSAFQKLQLHQSELLQNDPKAVRRVIEILGGHWGRIGLERKFEEAETALFNTKQRSDESNDSYLARSDVAWSKLLARKISLAELQAYILLRGSVLTAEEKKRVILDSDNSLEGELTLKKVTDSVRLLGADFFHEVTGAKKPSRTKIYDNATLMAETVNEEGEPESGAVEENNAEFAAMVEEDFVDQMIQEGEDPDAVFLADFEHAAGEILQSDPVLASAFSTYTEARRRLSEKFKSRGFWPPARKGSAVEKGKGKGKPRNQWPFKQNRNSLQARILATNCKACGRKGHWKAECPYRNSGTGNPSNAMPSGSSTAPTTVTVTEHDDAMAMEFIQLPLIEMPNLDESWNDSEFNFFCEDQFSCVAKNRLHVSLGEAHKRWGSALEPPTRIERTAASTESESSRLNPISSLSKAVQGKGESKSLHEETESGDLSLFATHGTYGVMDSGATRTVIGSDFVAELLQNLDPEIRRQVKRCKNETTFRFGNLGTLKSTQAIVVPLGTLLLKIAVVKGSTPFLLSNSLLRRLKAKIDCEHDQLHSPLLRRSVSLQPTPKGLYLVDLNDLAQAAVETAETPVQETFPQFENSSAEPPEKCHDADLGTAKAVCQQLNKTETSSNEMANLSDDLPRDEKQSKSFVADIEEPSVKIPAQKPVVKADQIASSRADHVSGPEQLSESSSSPPDPIRGTSGEHHSSRGFLSSWARRLLGSAHRLWKGTHGPSLSGGMARSPGLGQVVCEPLPSEPQEGTSDVSSLRGDHGGCLRRSPKSACNSSSRSEASDAQEQSHCKDESQSQGQSLRPRKSILRSEFPGRRIQHGRRGRCSYRDVCISDYGSESRGEHRHDCHAEPDAQPGECTIPSDRASWERGARGLNPLELAMIAGEIDEPESTRANPEYEHVRKLIQKISKELENTMNKVGHSHLKNIKSIDLLEVFCDKQSQLSQQVLNMDGQAIRHSLEHGDLMTELGRQNLFVKLISRKPKHVWFAPTCGPWSSWSALNASRSLEQWDAYQKVRFELLTQVALGIVLYRHQIESGNHFSWEQPQKSIMLRLPYMSEVQNHTQAAEFDMCIVGDLVDPVSKQPIKKSMVVLTTSSKMFEALHGRKCPNLHEHQRLEGSIKHQGELMNRTRFSERYTRKFARVIAKVLLQRRFPLERPFNWCLPAVNVEAANPNAKEHPESTGIPELIEINRENFSSNPSKRQRLEGKQAVETQDPKLIAQEIMNIVSRQLPRVGRTEIHHPKVKELCQRLCPEKQVIRVIGCKGTERCMSPPADLHKHQAPFRRALVLLRDSRELKMEKHWECWETLSNRKLIRKGHSCKVNITIFGCNPKISPRIEMPTEGNSIQEQPSPPAVVEKSSEVKDSQSSGVLDRHPIVRQQHGDRFLALSKGEQSTLMKMHKNLGHPANERLSHALCQQGHRVAVSQGVLDMHCEVCSQTSKPSKARPSLLKSNLEFNHRICVDGVEWSNKQGKSFHFYHAIDVGSNFHMAQVAPSRTSSKFVEFLCTSWINWAGPPAEITIDSATEFNSEETLRFFQRFNIKSKTTTPEAHWQNGKAERHGSFLQLMLDKIDQEQPITTYDELQQALIQSTHAKNSLSVRQGYSPELIVFGKRSRLPGSICGDELAPAHELANTEGQDQSSEDFRKMLKTRELARIAFHKADNDVALRRAALRRSCPHRGAYDQGEWVMIWRQSIDGGKWLGPMRVVVQEGPHTIWATQGTKLFRSSPENVRPIVASEVDQIPAYEDLQDITSIGTQLQRQLQNHRENEAEQIPQESHPVNRENINPNAENPREEQNAERTPQTQPDVEPPIESPQALTPMESRQASSERLADVEIDAGNEETQDANFLCCVEEPCLNVQEDVDSAWRVEFECMIPENLHDREPTESETWLLLATSAKKQRTEVRLPTLSSSEKIEFAEAKNKEINNWLQTGTIARVLRNQIPAEQILRCRWILTWKPLDQVDQDKIQAETGKQKTHKAKARLVVLGYLDPKLEEIPRDSPTMSRASRMLLMQLVASSQWSLRSFDIKAAFLQGLPQSDRVIGVEPVEEMTKAMNLQKDEVVYLKKSAYGLIDAPFQWYLALHSELIALGMTQSPFDPCLYMYWSKEDPSRTTPSGILGIHVDDGLCGGTEEFQKVLEKLEQKYPFGTKRVSNFTFTGIDIQQSGDHSITLNQSKYVCKIPSIKIESNRKTNPTEPVTEEERQALRGLVGSLQYAAVNTRPDIASKLSSLQSSINQATVGNLLEANKLLHESKKHADVSITIKSIPLVDFRFLAFSDASFASKSRPDSHAGMIIVGTHKEISKNVSCPISPLIWGCRKIQKVVTSTLSAETYSLASTLDQMSWLRLYWGWLMNPKLAWKDSEKTLKTLPLAVSVNTFKENKDIAVTDCKSLFDLTTRTAMPSCSEFRVSLQARAIKDLLAEGTHLRWVHSAAQLADALTKSMESQFLRETLRVGRYHLHDEAAVLKERANSKSRLKWLKQSLSEKEKNKIFDECEYSNILDQIYDEYLTWCPLHCCCQL